MSGNSTLCKLMVVISNVDLRLSCSNYLSKKPWAEVQNVLGFELARTLLAEEKFDAVVTDAGEGSGGLATFIKAIRSFRRNPNVTIIHVQVGSNPLADPAVDNDVLCHAWPWPVKDNSAEDLRIEIEQTRLKAAAPQPSDKKGFDARLLNAVLDAVRDVLGYYFSGENIDFGKPNFRKQPLTERSGITGLITIEGDKFKGSMALAASLDFLQLLSTKMFPEQDVKLTKEGTIDMIAELSNQVVGRIKMRFGDLGLSSNIGLPEVLMGKNHNVPHKVVDSAIFLGIKVDKAACEIELTVSQSPDFVIDEGKAVSSIKDILLFD